MKGKRANLVAINMCTKTGPRICEQKTKGRASIRCEGNSHIIIIVCITTCG